MVFEPQELSQPFRTDLTELVQASKALAKRVIPTTFSIRIRENQSRSERREASVRSLYYMPYMSVDGLLKRLCSLQ